MQQNLINLPMAIDTNVPEKKGRSSHIQNLIAVLFLYASIALGVYFYLTGQLQ